MASHSGRQNSAATIRENHYVPTDDQGLKNSYLQLDLAATVVHIIFYRFHYFSTPSHSHIS